jgi:hypothetical protein
MSGPRGIALALDLARMPALAHSIEKPPLPTDIFEIMRIAAGSPEVCQSASQVTGQPSAVLIEAARFYLQQMLLRPDADSYRVLGLPPGASRDLARSHMRCLLQWLHPDVNRDWDSVYAQRVLKAWREVSADINSARAPNSCSHLAGPGSRAPVNSRATIRMPWIEKPRKKMKLQPRHVLMTVAKRASIGVAVVALLVAVVAVYVSQSG